MGTRADKIPIKNQCQFACQNTSILESAFGRAVEVGDGAKFVNDDSVDVVGLDCENIPGV